MKNTIGLIYLLPYMLVLLVIFVINNIISVMQRKISIPLLEALKELSGSKTLQIVRQL